MRDAFKQQYARSVSTSLKPPFWRKFYTKCNVCIVLFRVRPLYKMQFKRLHNKEACLFRTVIDFFCSFKVRVPSRPEKWITHKRSTACLRQVRQRRPTKPCHLLRPLLRRERRNHGGTLEFFANYIVLFLAVLLYELYWPCFDFASCAEANWTATISAVFLFE